MNKSGEQIIEAVCQHLKETGRGHCLDDSTILREIRQMDRWELNELIIFGDLAKWIRERSKLKQKRDEQH